MNIWRWCKRNPLEAGLFLLAGGMVLLHSSDISAVLVQNRVLREQAAKNQKQTAELQIAQDNAQESAEIAKQRYQQGCVPIVANNDPKSLTSISIGMPVLDGVRQTPMAPGTVICDEKGGTAMIRDSRDLSEGETFTCTVMTTKGKRSFGTHCPVAADYAYTGDRTVVEAAIRRASVGTLKRSNSRI